jgi:hypothetical protein
MPSTTSPTRTVRSLGCCVCIFALAFIAPGASGQTAWSGWSSFPLVPPGAASNIAVAENSDGRLSVFLIGRDGALWRISQMQPNGGWNAWEQGSPSELKLSAAFESQRIGVGTNADGRLEVFAFSNNHLWHSWQTSPSGSWSDWSVFYDPPSNVGGGGSDIVIGRNADGRQEVFMKSSFNGQLYQTWQVTPNGGWSGEWHNMAGPGGSTAQIRGRIVVGLNRDGRQEVVSVGSDNRVWSTSQTAPNSGWKDWSQIPGSVNDSLDSPLSIIANQDGRLELFVAGISDLWHTWEDGTGAWGGFGIT